MPGTPVRSSKGRKRVSIDINIDAESPSPVRSDFSDDLVRGFQREASTPRLGSALHRSLERPRYLRGLTMRSKLRQGFADRFFRSKSDQFGDIADDADYDLHVKKLGIDLIKILFNE